MALSRIPARRLIQSRTLDDISKKRAFDAALSALGRVGAAAHYLQSLPPSKVEHGSSPHAIKHLSNDYPVEFARAYLLKNVVKCALAGEIYSGHFRNTRRIIDLGTGPGTFLFSFASSLKNNEFVGIDRNYEALRLCAYLFRLVRLSPPLLICASLPEAIASGGMFFTASYLLAELADHELVRLAQLVTLRADAQFLVVDYPEVIARFSSLIPDDRFHATCSVTTDLPEELSSRMGDDHVSFGALFAPAIATRYRAIS